MDGFLVCARFHAFGNPKTYFKNGAGAVMRTVLGDVWLRSKSHALDTDELFDSLPVRAASSSI